MVVFAIYRQYQLGNIAMQNLIVINCRNDNDKKLFKQDQMEEVRLITNFRSNRKHNPNPNPSPNKLFNLFNIIYLMYYLNN